MGGKQRPILKDGLAWQVIRDAWEPRQGQSLSTVGVGRKVHRGSGEHPSLRTTVLEWWEEGRRAKAETTQEWI